MPGQLAELTGIDGVTPIPYRILGDYRESWAADRQQVVHVYDVGWHLRRDFLDALIGFSEYQGGPVLNRHLPHAHPEFPWLWAESAELEGGIGIPVGDDPDNQNLIFARRGQGGEFPQADGTPPDDYFGLARYRVTYAPRDYTLLTDTELVEDEDEANLQGLELLRYVTRDRAMSAEALIVPILAGNANAGGLKFVDGSSGGKPLNQNPTVVVPGSQFIYRWHQVPAVPTETIEDYLGKVNAVEFDGIHDPESAMLIGAKLARGRDIRGKVAWDIDYLFQSKPVGGWNRFLDVDLRFTYVTLNGNLPTDPTNPGRTLYRSKTGSYPPASETDDGEPIQFTDLFVSPAPADDPFSAP